MATHMHAQEMSRLLTLGPAAAMLAMLAGILLIGYVDLVTGAEVRVYPLYFIPLSIGAWNLGLRGAFAGTLLATLTWYVANVQAGMVYSERIIWVINALAQAIAFGMVSLLIAGLRTLLAREQALSRTDTLTGLANSRAFYDSAETLLALCRRHDHPVCLAYIDLDNFKQVNDTLGHAEGDEVLRRVARVFRRLLRSSDLAARIGGDEFVIFLPETGAGQAAPLLERLRGALREELAIPGCDVSASIGAVAWARAPAQLETLVQGADQLMYEVKKGGKNRVRVIDGGQG